MDKKRLAVIIFTVLLPFLLLLLSYQLVFAFTEYTPDQQSTIDYLNNKGELKPDYVAEESSHLKDVKGVMKIMDHLFYALLLVCSLMATYFYRNKKGLPALFLYGGIASLSLAVIFIIFTLLNFDLMFNLFHQLFFPQGNWTFPFDALLIQTFPLDFFISIAQKILLLYAVTAIFFIVGGFFLKDEC